MFGGMMTRMLVYTRLGNDDHQPEGIWKIFPVLKWNTMVQKNMIILGVVDIKCAVKNKILAYVFKIQNIPCKMNREVLHWLSEFYTSWNKTNHIPQYFIGIYLEKYISWYK